MSESNAIFTLTDKTYVSAIWFFDRGDHDWLAMLSKKDDGAYWEFIQRFRYHADDKIHESRDRKTAYSSKWPSSLPEKEVREVVDRLVSMMDETFTGDMTIIECRCYGDEAAEKLLASPFAHAQKGEN